ncbi:MAG: hypothetical protein LBL35_02795 [Clostridiales bacterium]|jgi:uncharacterized membrane protein YkvI|nr:hypothetical protein [Clostridiales bacterium]
MVKKNVFKIAGVYTAIILGAGFASGRELLEFFVRYGRDGIFGLALAGVMFSVTGWAVLEICRVKKINDGSEFIEHVAGKKLGTAINASVSLFFFVLYSTMLSAAGAALYEAFGLPTFVGVTAAGGLCFVTMLFDLDGIVNVNSFLAPFMVVGGIAVGVYAFLSSSPAFAPEPIAAKGNWAASAVTYAAYNIVTSVTVLASISHMSRNKKTSFFSGVTGGLAMTALGAFMALPLFSAYGKAASFEIPLLAVLPKSGDLIKALYIIILMAAIYTTAVANGFAFTQMVSRRSSQNVVFLKAVVTIAAICAARIRFSSFVGKIYPAFGLAGIIVIVCVFRRFANLCVEDAARKRKNGNDASRPRHMDKIKKIYRKA